VALGPGTTAAQTTSSGIAPANFQARTVPDLAALCGAGPQDPNAAVRLRRGYLVGVGQFHAALHPPGEPRPPLFCSPMPPQAIAQVAANFAAWARTNTQHAGERAVDGLARWARETYPCPSAPPPAAGRRRGGRSG
jgi:hypothetical protein